MNKPLTVAREDFRRAVTEAINDSCLPAFVVFDALQAVLYDVGRAAQHQYAADLKAYQESEVEQNE